MNIQSLSPNVKVRENRWGVCGRDRRPPAWRRRAGGEAMAHANPSLSRLASETGGDKEPAGRRLGEKMEPEARRRGVWGGGEG